VRKMFALLCTLGIVAIFVVLTGRAIAAAPLVDRSTGPSAAAALVTGDAPIPDLRPDNALARTVSHGRGTSSVGTCDEARRGWRTTSGRPLLLEVWRCSPFQWAADRQAASLEALRQAGASIRPVIGIPYAVQAALDKPVGDLPAPATVLLFRRGSYLVTVRFVSAADRHADDEETAARIALWQWNHLVGQPGSGARVAVLEPTVKRTGEALAVIVVGLYLAANLVGSVRNRARRLKPVTPAPVDSPRIRWLDVSRRAWKLGLVARARFWLAVVALVLAQILPVSTTVRVAFYAFPVLLFTLNRRHTPGGREVWGRHAESQVNTGKNPVAARAGFLGATALLLAALVALLASAVLVTLCYGDIVGPDGRWHPTLIADDPHPWRLVPVRLLAADLLVVVVALLLASGVVYRLARAVAARDAREKLALDRRPPIIFLRNFSDDNVTIQTSPLTRKSMIDKLGIRQFERFEEILVRYLSVYGPVVAVNDPRLRRAPLGAARESFPHDAWQEGVAKYLDSSAMIVVAAAPDRATDGLQWELKQIDRGELLRKTVFVVPPYSAQQVLSRWSVFQKLAGRIAFPPEVVRHADHTLVLTPGCDGTWRGFRAAHRTDWAYAVALAAAAEQIPTMADESRAGLAWQLEARNAKPITGRYQTTCSPSLFLPRPVGVIGRHPLS